MNMELAWDGQSKGSLAGSRIFVWLVSRLGILPAYLLLVFVSLAYTLSDKKSGLAIRALRTHLGRPTSLVHLFRHFFSFGMSLIDRYAFLIGKRSPFAFVSIREDVIAQALGRGKGVILLGSHIGNWEIAGNLLSDRLGAPVHYVMVDAEKSDVRSVFKEALSRRKTSIISIGSDGLELMLKVRDALRKNCIVCMHGDRSIGRKGAGHSFLGEQVIFPVGPFAIGAATGSPVIPIVVIKSGLRKYVFKAFAPILFEGIDPANRDKVIYTAMERYVGILEQVVKEKPYEWFNFYDFWGDDSKPAE